ncbi:PLP-dependent aminotransferase family protein [Streptomyces sp. NPDC041068]|uniref:aminotransferase-like domain-containing protein n=1 Tax=Streptomyces sp. NPDC041068 TaxID=3155130 RepID=UPI0033EBA7B7
MKGTTVARHDRRPQGCELRLDDLHTALADPVLESMNFLNEISGTYPDAVSFAAGRPCDDLLETASVQRCLDRYIRYLAEEQGRSAERIRETLLQYGPTKGVIGELIARNLAVDEGIDVPVDSVVVTVGCQEALFLVLRALCTTGRDAVLAVSPTYMGLTGAARLVGMPVLPVASGAGGVDFADLRAVLDQARRTGLHPRACYVVPDFANPTGLSLSVEDRQRLLRIAEEEDLLLLEDNPYGLFHDGGAPTPTLKALDTRRRVVYLGSFAKTALPGARVGFVVADQRVADAASGPLLFADHLARIKSMVTVNTSPIAQAVIGGKLLESGCSLRAANARAIAHYRRNRRILLAGLERRFGGTAASGIHWNSPAGGFFVVLTVPFAVDDRLLERSAQEFGVLWTPMRHFHDGADARRRLRLSCSALTPERIEEGLDRLAALVAERITTRSESREEASCTATY